VTHRRTVAAVCAVAALTFSACTRPNQTTAASTDRLRIAIPINPSSIDPILSQNTVEEFVDDLVFDKLVTQDQNHNEIPDLASVVPTQANGGISKDGLTITYHLRRGVTWQDGAPFTSRDVKFTWQAIVSPNNNVVSRRGYDEIASLDTPDAYTVVMHMKRVFPPAIDTIFGESDTPYDILPAHILAKYPNLNRVPFNAEPIGTGPFRVTRWIRGDRIELDANPKYFRGAPKIAHLIVSIIQDTNTTTAELRAHDVDLAIEITAPSYRDIGSAPGVVRQLVDAPVYTSFVFNVARPPLDDVRVRRALVMGLDRQRLTQDDSYGTAVNAIADLSPYYWAYDPSLRPLPYDRAGAEALLDAAGWRRGPNGMRAKNGVPLQFVLAYGLGSDIGRTLTVQLQAAYRAMGIDVQLKGYDFETYYASAEAGGILNGGKFDLGLYSWVSGADPDNSSQWTCRSIPPAGNNVTRYCSPAMDAAQAVALSTFDRARRKRAYSRIESLLVRDAPAAFVYYQRLRYAHVAGLQNFEPNGISEAWNAQEWSL